MKSFNTFLNEKNGLWDNIHAKRKRGEKPNPPGHPDRPTAQDFKDAQKTSKKENYVSDAQRKAVWASRNDEKKKAKESVEEKKLTPAELKKREEIAKAMERENPGMDMSKKMAIATAQAKKVTEEKVDEISLSQLSNTIAKSTGTKNIKTAMKSGEVKKGLDDLKKRLGTLGQEPKMAKEAKEDDEPASQDEASMALKQLEFIEYAAEEMMDHIKSGKAFPEWFQNKLSKAHGEIEGLHSAMGEHGSYEDDEEEMDEAYRVHAVSKDGEKMKSGVHPTKKAASDMHYKMAKSGMYKKIEVVKETAQLDEISKKTLGSYVKKASADVANRSADNARDYATGNRPVGANKKAMKNMKRTKYLNKAVDKMTQEGVQSADKKPEKYIKPNGKVGIRMVRVDKKVIKDE